MNREHLENISLSLSLALSLDLSNEKCDLKVKS